VFPFRKAYLLRRFFNSAELNINDYTIELDRNVHKIIHGRGIGLKQRWNAQWSKFFAVNPRADSNATLRHLEELKVGFYLP